MDLLRAEKSGLQSGVESRQSAIDSIILQNHPIFSRIQKLTNTKYRVFFSNIDEMEAWLKARQYHSVVEDEWDNENDREYITGGESKTLLKVKSQLFDEKGFLLPMLSSDWSENFVISARLRPSPSWTAGAKLDDDIPF